MNSGNARSLRTSSATHGFKVVGHALISFEVVIARGIRRGEERTNGRGGGLGRDRIEKRWLLPCTSDEDAVGT
jgi:hypothetical protein